MNERIGLLAEQATTIEYGADRGFDRVTFDKEKFAELIVKECYAHCAGQLMDKPLAEAHGLTYNDGVMDCAIGLLQHFGVEE
jgi:hypothetical protein